MVGMFVLIFFSLQRLDIRGKLKVLNGQNKKTEDAPLALFCLCTPFGPPSMLEMPHKEVMFKSKHKLDFGFVSMDQRWVLFDKDTRTSSKRITSSFFWLIILMKSLFEKLKDFFIQICEGNKSSLFWRKCGVRFVFKTLKFILFIGLTA